MYSRICLCGFRTHVSYALSPRSTQMPAYSEPKGLSGAAFMRLDGGKPSSQDTAAAGQFYLVSARLGRSRTPVMHRTERWHRRNKVRCAHMVWP